MTLTVPPHVFDATDVAVTCAGNTSVTKKLAWGDVLTLKIVNVRVNGVPADTLVGVNALTNCVLG